MSETHAAVMSVMCRKGAHEGTKASRGYAKECVGGAYSGRAPDWYIPCECPCHRRKKEGEKD